MDKKKRAKTLLIMVNAYLRRTKTHPCAFGQQVVGDRHLVADLRKGRVVGDVLHDKIWKATAPAALIPEPAAAKAPRPKHPPGGARQKAAKRSKGRKQ